jgi:hypothetical protein
MLLRPRSNVKDTLIGLRRSLIAVDPPMGALAQSLRRGLENGWKTAAEDNGERKARRR